MSEREGFFGRHMKKIIGAGIVAGGLAASEMRSNHDHEPVSAEDSATETRTKSARRLLDAVPPTDATAHPALEEEIAEEAPEEQKNVLDMATIEDMLSRQFPGMKKYDPTLEHPYDQYGVSDVKYTVAGHVISVGKIAEVFHDKETGAVIQPFETPILDIDTRTGILTSGVHIEVEKLEKPSSGGPQAGEGGGTETIPFVSVDLSDLTDEERAEKIRLVNEFVERYYDSQVFSPDATGNTVQAVILELNNRIMALEELRKNPRYADLYGDQGQAAFDVKIKELEELKRATQQHE